jgi:hypothetical protein
LSTIEKIERLKSEVRKVERYELMTTNQYRDNIDLVIEILEDLVSKYVESGATDA